MPQPKLPDEQNRQRNFRESHDREPHILNDEQYDRVIKRKADEVIRTFFWFSSPPYHPNREQEYEDTLQSLALHVKLSFPAQGKMMLVDTYSLVNFTLQDNIEWNSRYNAQYEDTRTWGIPHKPWTWKTVTQAILH